MADSEYAYPDLVWIDEYPNGKVYTCVFYRPLTGFCTLKEAKDSVQVLWYTEKEFQKYFPEYHE